MIWFTHVKNYTLAQSTLPEQTVQANKEWHWHKRQAGQGRHLFKSASAKNTYLSQHQLKTLI